MQQDPFHQDPDEHDARLLLCQYIQRQLTIEHEQGTFPGYALSSVTRDGEPCLHLFISGQQIEISMRFGRAELPANMDIRRNRWFEYIDPTTPGERGYWRIEDGHQQAILTEFLRAYGRWLVARGPQPL